MASSLPEFGRWARQIRSYVLERVNRELRAAMPNSRTSLSARDVAMALELADRFPLICTALDANRFKNELRQQGLALVGRTGPRQSSTVRWTFSTTDPKPTEMQDRLSGETSERTPSPQPVAAKRVRFTLAGQMFEIEIRCLGPFA
jgi:hypothetical protein